MPIPIWPRRDPLTAMVLEFAVACGHSPEVIAEVRINRGWAVVRRGEGELDPGTFTLAALCGERGRELLPEPGAATTSGAEAPRRGRLGRILDRSGLR